MIDSITKEKALDKLSKMKDEIKILCDENELEFIYEYTPRSLNEKYWRDSGCTIDDYWESSGC